MLWHQIGAEDYGFPSGRNLIAKQSAVLRLHRAHSAPSLLRDAEFTIIRGKEDPRKSVTIRDAECSRLSGETDPRCLISEYINSLQNNLQVVVENRPS